MKRKSDNTNDPPAKHAKNPLNKYVQSRPRTPPRSPSPIVVTETQKSLSKRANKTAQQMSSMKSDKTKDNYTKAIVCSTSLQISNRQYWQYLGRQLEEVVKLVLLCGGPQVSAIIQINGG
eukprot:14648761-Ditylum_brightwellii.AAC.1